MNRLYDLNRRRQERVERLRRLNLRVVEETPAQLPAASADDDPRVSAGAVGVSSTTPERPEAA